MKWTSHKATAGITVVALGFNSIETIIVMIGSYFPDYIEMLIAGKNNNTWNKIHRKLFHWWILYLIHMVIVLIFFNDSIFRVTAYISAGAYLHIIGDALTIKGVPLLNPFKQDLKLGYFKTGSKQEYRYVLIYVAVISLLIYILGNFNYHDFVNSGVQETTFFIQKITKFFTDIFINKLKH